MRGLAPVEARWLDSQTVVRRTWTQFARKGYSLANLAQHLGIEFQHHDALEDAIATARILRRVLADSGRTASEWEAMVGAQARARVVRSGHSDRSPHLVNIDAASLTRPGVSPSR
jgi:DNA polymerase III epsilon subunit-like protein